MRVQARHDLSDERAVAVAVEVHVADIESVQDGDYIVDGEIRAVEPSPVAELFGTGGDGIEIRGSGLQISTVDGIRQSGTAFIDDEHLRVGRASFAKSVR